MTKLFRQIEMNETDIFLLLQLVNETKYTTYAYVACVCNANLILSKYFCKKPSKNFNTSNNCRPLKNVPEKQVKN